MNNLLSKARGNKKGFTLVELIVVIVIIAILIAALTPAILGVIQRANRSADESDLRVVMMAGTVAGTFVTGSGLPTADGVIAQISGGTVTSGTYTLFFDATNSFVVGGRLVGGRTNTTGATPLADRVTIGQVTTNILPVPIGVLIPIE